MVRGVERVSYVVWGSGLAGWLDDSLGVGGEMLGVGV